MNAIDSINNPFTPGVNYGDVVLTLESVDRILWCDKYFCRVLFVWGIKKKHEIKHFLEFLFWPPVTGSERVKLMYVIVHAKYLPDNKV